MPAVPAALGRSGGQRARGARACAFECLARIALSLTSFLVLSWSSAHQASFKIGSTKILNESKHINLSLHYLEMVRALNCAFANVPLPWYNHFFCLQPSSPSPPSSCAQCITALHDRAIHPERHTHVPYRNCMMTSVLKDSLGGNCKVRCISIASLGRAFAVRRHYESHSMACIALPCTADGHDRHHVGRVGQFQREHLDMFVRVARRLDQEQGANQ